MTAEVRDSAGCRDTRAGKETGMKQGNDNRTPQKRGVSPLASRFLILTAGILWGCMGLFVRPLDARGLSAWEIVFLRASLTTVILFAIVAVCDRAKLRVRLRDLWCFAGTGLLSIVFFNLCYFTAITITSLSVAAILLYTAPAFVMVISAFAFREKLTPRKIISLALAFLGLVLVTGVLGGGERLTPTVLFTGLGAGLGYALYSVFGRCAILRGYDSLTISFYTFLFAAAGTAVFADVSAVVCVACASPSNALLAVAFVAVSTVIPYLTYTAGLRGVENGAASIIAAIEPVVAALNGILWLREKLSVGLVFGIALVLGGIILCNTGTAAAESEKNG